MSFSPRTAWAMVEAHLAVFGVSLLVMFGATVNAQQPPIPATPNQSGSTTRPSALGPSQTKAADPLDRAIATRRVKGRVVDRRGVNIGRAVVRYALDRERFVADIHASLASNPTDLQVQSAGSFTLDVPDFTPIVIVAEAVGFAPAFLAVPVRGDYECDILLDLPTRIVGTVLDSRSRRPLVGATVKATDVWGRGVMRTTTTDSNGRYELTDTKAGRWEFTLNSDGYARHVESMELMGDKAPVDFTLSAGRQLEVTVSQRGLGTPIKGATVQCDDRTLKTGEDGVVRFDHLDDKVNFVHVSAEGYGPVRFVQFGNATVARTIKISIELSPQVIIAGQVVDDQSRPVEGALVSFSRYDWPYDGLEGHQMYLFHAVSPTGSDGRFRIMIARRENLGWHEPQGYLRAAHATLGIAKLPCNEWEVVEAHLGGSRDEFKIVFSTESRSVHGIVDDENRDPVKGVLVKATMDTFDPTTQSSDRPWCITDESGAYQIDGLRSGPITLRAWGEGIVGRRIKLPSNETGKALKVDLPVERIRTIPGRIVSPEGTPVVPSEILRVQGSKRSTLLGSAIYEEGHLDSTIQAEGRFVARFTPSEVHSIEVSATGYMHQVVTYSGKDEWVIQLTRDPKFVLVRGTVVDARSQVPLRHANVTFDLLDAHADPAAVPNRVRLNQVSATTRIDGTFELAVERGKYALGASHSDSGVSTSRWIEVDTATAPLRIEIVPACYVDFRIKGFDEKWLGPPVMIALMKDGDPSAVRVTAKPDVNGHIHFRLEADATYFGTVIRACGNPPIEIDDEMNWAVGYFPCEEIAPFRTESAATITKEVRLLKFGCIDVTVNVRDARSVSLPHHYDFHVRGRLTRMDDLSCTVRTRRSRDLWPSRGNPFGDCVVGFAPTTTRQIYLPIGRYKVEAHILGTQRDLEIEVGAWNPAALKLDFVVPDEKLPEGFLPRVRERK